MRYGLIITNNHYLAVVEGKRYIIDTGSPKTFCRQGRILFMSEERQVSPLCELSNEAAIVSLVGKDFDGLIGTDLLIEHVITFDRKNSLFVVDEKYLTIEGTTEMEIFKDPPHAVYPYISIKLNGKEVKAILDTGASISYASESVLSGTRVAGKVKDYSPSIGHFETKIYESCFSLKDMGGTISLGILPKVLEEKIKPSGFDAVIGLELFNKYDCVSLNFIDRRIDFGSGKLK